jgi:hypothetical protein
MGNIPSDTLMAIHGPHHLSWPAHKIKACTARLQGVLDVVIVTN